MAAVQWTNEVRQGGRWEIAGHLVGTLFGVVWANAATSSLPQPARAGAWMVIALIVVFLVVRVFRQRTLIGSEPRSPQERRRATRGFLLLFVGEIVAMNAVAILLERYHRLDYLMPAVATIVGLHFLPMAALFRMTIYRTVGTLMTAFGITAVAAMASGVAIAPVLQSMELACAFALWGAVFLRLRSTG